MHSFAGRPSLTRLPTRTWNVCNQLCTADFNCRSVCLCVRPCCWRWRVNRYSCR